MSEGLADENDVTGDGTPAEATRATPPSEQPTRGDGWRDEGDYQVRGEVAPTVTGYEVGSRGEVTERPSVREEAIARVRNEAQGIAEEPATISHEEAEARARGEIILPETDRATSYDQDQEQARAILARAEAEVARERAERADPDTARLVEARDQEAAGGRFAEADSTQRLIDSIRTRAAERAQGETRAERHTAAERGAGSSRSYPPPTRGHGGWHR